MRSAALSVAVGVIVGMGDGVSVDVETAVALGVGLGDGVGVNVETAVALGVGLGDGASGGELLSPQPATASSSVLIARKMCVLIGSPFGRYG
jgi:hypothetical protein